MDAVLASLSILLAKLSNVKLYFSSVIISPLYKKNIVLKSLLAFSTNLFNISSTFSFSFIYKNVSVPE